MVLRFAAQRIEIGHQMSTHAIGVDQHQHSGLFGQLGRRADCRNLAERGPDQRPDLLLR